MIDIIRVKLPSGVKRFPMFTTKDQLSFLLTSADMEGREPSEQQQILDEVLDLLYPGYSKTEQEYIFTKVYCSSFGKNVIKIGIKGKSGMSEAFMVIREYELQNEYELAENIKLGFAFPKTRKISEDLFIECIRYIIHDGIRYEWPSLHEETKNNILDMVSMEDIEKIIVMLTKSCEMDVRGEKFSSFPSLFKILFSKSDLNEFYKTNYLLNKNNIRVDTIMDSSPMERSIYVALLAEDLKKQNSQNQGQ